VAWQDLDPMPALRACEAAIKLYPEELRFQLQYARAQLKAGHLVEARLWFRTAAEKGYVAAQRHVGHMYLMSLGVPADDSKAVGWYRKAAEQDDARAQYLLGMLHVLGRGVPQDNLQAIGWLRRAAGQGNAGARFVLHWMYSQGRSVQSIAAAGPRP
jgi:TPR repeat protein